MTVLLQPHEIFTYAVPFEAYFSLEEYRSWTSSRMYFPFLTVACYILFIMFGQEFMRERKPLNVKPVLVLWNIGLATYSILATWRSHAFLMHDIRRGHTFNQIVCYVEQDNVAAFWNFSFVVSKFVELGDTFFLIARKKDVLFLHWYHHASVLIYTWITNVDNCPLGKFFMLMNVFVHSLMYTYYALTAVGVRVPKPISMSITSLQISQMVGGMFFLCASTIFKFLDPGCNAPSRCLWLGGMIYGSYFALFVKFFLNAYLSTSKKRVTVKTD